jgi:NAD(P)-dependent dehydrogenase (short-subunit alcohol dehydrogenase family)
LTAPPKRALVTGGSAGLGAASVGWLQANGYEVVVLDRDRPWTGKTPVKFIRCDLASRTELDDVLPDLTASGPYDLVLLNAGINATGKFETLDPRAHIDVLRVNAEAPMVIAAALLESNSCRSGAAMIFVSSLSHFTGYPGAASYAASKDALAIYARSMRKYAASKWRRSTVAFPGSLEDRSCRAAFARRAPMTSKRMDPDQALRRNTCRCAGGQKELDSRSAQPCFRRYRQAVSQTGDALMRRLIYSNGSSRSDGRFGR